MPRRKTVKNTPILPWLSANLDCREQKNFSQVGTSLLQNEAFQKLSYGAEICYLSMTLHANGRREFEFSSSTAERFGINDRSLRRYIKELTEGGFITTEINGKSTRTPNRYSFSFAWKEKKKAP